MKRIHLFEFEDFKWLPNYIRDGGTDFLGFLLGLTQFYTPAVEILEELLIKTKQLKILDLCSGNGGPIKFVNHKISQDLKIKYVLSDKYPNIPAYQNLKKESNNKIDFRNQPLDVLHMDSEVEGVRTMFSAIHHFEPNEVKTILQIIVEGGKTICIFDSGDKHIGTIIGILLFHPLLFFFGTPFIRPFKFSRIIFTYFIPAIPISTIWDGIISILRLYDPNDLMKIAKSVDEENAYDWQCGKRRNRVGLSVAYLIGIPKTIFA